MARTTLVSHYGEDLGGCGNWTMPCRTVRHAVNISKNGDQIYIDYAQGRPYMECENRTQSTCSIELTKSVSFYGINGRTELRCKKSCKFFVIKSPNSHATRINFFNLVISNSCTATELYKETRSKLVFNNTVVKDNLYAIFSKNSIDCSITITNSSFEHNFHWGIHLRCANLTFFTNSSTFKLTPVKSLTNIAEKPRQWQKTEILIRNTIFNGKNVQKCVSMLTIKPFAAIFNVTITDSEFKNHVAICKSKYTNQFSTLRIYDHQSTPRKITFIFLGNLLIENNRNTWAALSVTVGYLNYTEVEVMLRDSILRNNSIALRVSIVYFGKGFPVKFPTIYHENNTFIGNVNEVLKPDGAAAIYFGNGKSRVSSCRFLDNRAGEIPYTGVVTISAGARVTFYNSHFENRQTEVRSNQLFAAGNRPVNFVGKNTFNLVALKDRQTVFIRTPTVFNTGAVIRKNFRIFCPQGYTLNQQRQCDLIKKGIKCYYINIQCEQCPSERYTLERGKLIFNRSNDIQCQQCPRGGDCNNGLVRSKPNFWGYKTKMKLHFIQCPPGYCCDTKICVTYNSCYGNRSGTLCGQCSVGMSESLFSTECISNKKCSLNYIFLFGAIAMLILYLVFFLYHSEILNFLRTDLLSKTFSFLLNGRNNHRSNSSTDSNIFFSSGLIKVFFYYYQVCNLLRSSVGSPKNGQFIYNLDYVISKVMNIILVNLSSIDCLFKDLRAVPKAVILHSVGYFLLALLCPLYLISELLLIIKRRKNNDEIGTTLEYIATTSSVHRSRNTKLTLSKRIVSGFTYISLLMYASSAQLCLSLLRCVPVGDNQVLFLDGNIKCYQTFQYFLLAYMILAVIPFCLVPVLGTCLLNIHRIGAKQFCAGCIVPLPFCCYWLYLLLKDFHCGTCNTIEETNSGLNREQEHNETSRVSDEEVIFDSNESNETTFAGNESAILRVLLGSFRPYQAFMCFPSSRIPWEGFLIFRRLLLIIVMTFVYDIQLRLFLALIVCLVILIVHMFVKPFQRKRDNALESFSLGIHIILCALTLIRAFYYGENYSSFSNIFPLLSVIENILIFAPLSIIMIVVTLSIAIKLAFALKLCVLVVVRKTRNFIRWLAV